MHKTGKNVDILDSRIKTLKIRKSQNLQHFKSFVLSDDREHQVYLTKKNRWL